VSCSFSAISAEATVTGWMQLPEGDGQSSTGKKILASHKFPDFALTSIH
jgi:hypothetical protein